MKLETLPYLVDFTAAMLLLGLSFWVGEHREEIPLAEFLRWALIFMSGYFLVEMAGDIVERMRIRERRR